MADIEKEAGRGAGDPREAELEQSQSDHREAVKLALMELLNEVPAFKSWAASQEGRATVPEEDERPTEQDQTRGEGDLSGARPPAPPKEKEPTRPSSGKHS